jgi:hypothetical protein
MGITRKKREADASLFLRAAAQSSKTPTAKKPARMRKNAQKN